MSKPESVLQLQDLVVEFKTETGRIRAVDGITLGVQAGQTLGIVGESGCGKSVTSLAIMGLVPQPAGRVAGGRILFDGQDLTQLNEAAYRKIRGNDISMIFQEPMTALNPVYTIGNQMTEVLRLHRGLSKAEAKEEAINLLASVDLESPANRIRQYPHELSGGMRQRVMIAMALSCNPRILIADEPTTALDVTVQAQVLAQIKKQQDSRGMSMIMITHDLGVIAETCETVAVMYCGKVVEHGTTEEIFNAPRHPYTQGLLKSIPRIRKEKLESLPIIPGIVPDLHHLPAGCRFADRCPFAEDDCRQSEPPLTAENGHRFACYHPHPA